MRKWRHSYIEFSKCLNANYIPGTRLDTGENTQNKHVPTLWNLQPMRPLSRLLEKGCMSIIPQ